MTNSFAGINFDEPNIKNIVENQNKNRDKDIISYEQIIDNMLINIIPYPNKYLYIISGKILNFNMNNIFVKYWGANKPTFCKSFSGSALPYPNEKIAFENSINVGMVQVVNSRFSFNITLPNSYYINMGTELIPPSINLIIIDSNNKQLTNKYTINLSKYIPYRTLTWDKLRNWNEGPLFYTNLNLPVIDQYEILNNSKYPTKQIKPMKFWNGKPPL